MKGFLIIHHSANFSKGMVEHLLSKYGGVVAVRLYGGQFILKAQKLKEGERN